MAKIGLISFQNSWNTINNETRWRLFKQIRKYAKDNRVSFLLFSGSTLFDKVKRDDKAVLHDIGRLGNFFKDFSIIFEINRNCMLEHKCPPYGLYAFEKGVQKGGPICQLFAKSKDDKKKYFELWNQIQCENRTVCLDKKFFLILICGEMNILHNSQNNGNKVDGLRYALDGECIRNVNYDILFNPTHRPLRGLYGKYKYRLKYMSGGKRGRMAMLNFNVPKGQNKRTAAFIAYKNSHEILRGENEVEDWSKGWAMRIIDA